MKVYMTEEKELIMEPFLKWAGNPDIAVAVKAYGLKATVQVACFLIVLNSVQNPNFFLSKQCFWMSQVVDFQIFAQPRITLKPLVPSFPCFANIFVSLMEKVGDEIFDNQTRGFIE